MEGSDDNQLGEKGGDAGTDAVSGNAEAEDSRNSDEGTVVAGEVEDGEKNKTAAGTDAVSGNAEAEDSRNSDEGTVVAGEVEDGEKNKTAASTDSEKQDASTAAENAAEQGAKNILEKYKKAAEGVTDCGSVNEMCKQGIEVGKLIERLNEMATVADGKITLKDHIVAFLSVFEEVNKKPNTPSGTQGGGRRRRKRSKTRRRSNKKGKRRLKKKKSRRRRRRR